MPPRTPVLPLPGTSIAQFQDPLPLLSVAGGSMQTVIAGTGEIELHMREFQAHILPVGTIQSGIRPTTWVYGYTVGPNAPATPLDTFIGPVIVATRGIPTQIRWVNNLGRAAQSKVAVWPLCSDQTLHWADPLHRGENMCAHMIMPDAPPRPMCAKHYGGPIPAVPHLHGGEVPAAIDGGPNAWFTGDGAHHGNAYYAGPGGGGNTAVYRYPNTQEAAPAWFHDHVLGGTRLNVYAGLAGAFPIIDPNLQLPTGLHPVGLQQGNTVDYLIPLVIQDRSFDTTGQLLFPVADPAAPDYIPEHPFWLPEFVGDTNLVNGKVWPYLQVEPRRYRFLIINGANARAYELLFTNPQTATDGPSIWQIGTDGGYLDTPVKIDPTAPTGQPQRLLVLPGERADIIVDFAGLQGQILELRNVAPHPYPGGDPSVGTTVGQVMQIRVGTQTTGDTSYDAGYDPASGIPLRPSMVRLADPTAGTLAAGVTADRTRLLTLNEVMNMATGGIREILLNNTTWSGLQHLKKTSWKAWQAPGGARPDFTPVTVGGVTEYFSELPAEGETEVWEIVNLTADAHPIHTHLTQVQILNRQVFNLDTYLIDYDNAFPPQPGSPPGTPGPGFIPGYGPPLNYNTGNPKALGGNPDITPHLQGPIKPAEPNEAGWKDTVVMYPGQVTRIVVRYAPTDTPAGSTGAYPFNPSACDHGYVWHCHIIDHEDNEMMRPVRVTPNPAANRTYHQGSDY